MINLGFKALWQLLFVPNVLDKRVYQESSSSMNHGRVKVLIFLAKIWTQRSVLGWEHAKHAQLATHMLLSPVFGCEVAFLHPVTWSRGKMMRLRERLHFINAASSLHLGGKLWPDMNAGGVKAIRFLVFRFLGGMIQASLESSLHLFDLNERHNSWTVVLKTDRLADESCDGLREAPLTRAKLLNYIFAVYSILPVWTVRMRSV